MEERDDVITQSIYDEILAGEEDDEHALIKVTRTIIQGRFRC